MQDFKTQSFISGEWVGSANQIDVLNPATGKSLASVANASISDCLLAVDAADAAFISWRATAPRVRAEILRKAFEIMIAEQEQLARLITLEMGKILADSRAEVAYAAEFFRWFSEEAVRIDGDYRRAPGGANWLMVSRQPVGVALLATPWNFPAAMATRKIGPALAAGCTVVLKPAQDTPLTALAIADVLQRAGVPAGVVNVVVTNPSGPAVAAMMDSGKVRKLSFTGSTKVGSILLAQAAPRVINCSMELGGNAPFLVFGDADIDAAVTGAMFAKYRNAGQACVAANRFYVHKKVHDQFVEKFALATKAIKVGSGLEQGVTQGPLIDDQALAKVQKHIADAISKGAKVVTGGKVANQGGTFFEPTVLANANNSMLVAYEETFGPVAPVIPFESDEEVVKLANHSQFGLASYFYSRDIGRIWKVSEALEFGMVGVNTGLFSNEVGPFGGIKQSGLGREGSSWGIDEYLEMKYVCVGI